MKLLHKGQLQSDVPFGIRYAILWEEENDTWDDGMADGHEPYTDEELERTVYDLACETADMYQYYRGPGQPYADTPQLASCGSLILLSQTFGLDV